MWDCSVFSQYSYYCDFSCLGLASNFCDHCNHGWVRYIDTTKITVWCMSSLQLSIDIQWFVILLCFHLNFHIPYFFSQISNLFICDIFEQNLFASDKAIHNLRFLIINNKYSNRVSVIKPSDHWKTGLYQGSADHCEGYRDSDINSLASEILGNKPL